MKLAADANFNHHILHGLLRRLPELDIQTAQEAGLSQASDAQILKWAIAQGRVLLTHDWYTIVELVYQRVAEGVVVPGVVYVPQSMPIGRAIEELELLIVGSLPSELEGRVIRLPL
jgi:hypothetical protein